MRMFLIGMCDIFLILYLTAMANVQPASVLTIEDFYALKQRHETLQEEKQKEDLAYQELLAKEQAEKDQLAAKLNEEKDRLKKIQKSLSLSDVERAKINKDLQEKVDALKQKEESLAKLNEEIKRKEEEQRKLEEVFQKELKDQEKIAFKALEEAKTIKKQANVAKEKALKEKQAAEKKATAAQAARAKAEAEKTRALKTAKTATLSREQAEQKIKHLVETVENIKQDGESAYNNNIRPRMQMINVTYERRVSNDEIKYERELSLLPVKIDGNVYGVFPSKQIGFLTGSDKAPNQLVMSYKEKPINAAWINKEEDLIAIAFHDYKDDVLIPYADDVPIADLMPALLAIRNNGNTSLVDKIRNISDSYFIVNRDYLETNEDGVVVYEVSGFRGTGTRAERIVRGDQLVDLTGRLIGVASDTDQIIRVDTLSGWEKISF